MLTLTWPWALLALPLPLLVARLPRAPDDLGTALRFPLDPDGDLGALPGARGRVPFGRRGFVAAVIWVLLVLAAARPEWVGEPIRLPVTGRDLMIAVDVSGSMEVADYELGNRMVSRLALVKALAAQFVGRREQDRIGLVLFGSRAYLLSPLTFDRTTVATLLEEAIVGLAGRETAVGDAIAVAVKHLKDQPEDNRVLVLMTDGASNAGHIAPLAAAELAAGAGVRVYPIGIGGGSTAARWSPGVDPLRAGNDFDPDTLRRIAEITGGRFFSAHARRELEAIYAELDRLEPSRRDERSFRPQRALFMWPAGLALLLSFALVGQWVRSAGRGRRVV